MIPESQVREDIVRLSKSLFDRGYSVGSTGNISARVKDGFLITPTKLHLCDCTLMPRRHRPRRPLPFRHGAEIAAARGAVADAP